jgi:hypothetical protein
MTVVSRRLAQLPVYKVTKTVAFSGASGNGAVGTVNLFTVSGLCRMSLVGYCTEDLVSAGGGTIRAGVSGADSGLIAQITATDLDNGEVWRDASPSVLDGEPSVVYTAGNVILTVGTADVTDGTITFYLQYTPIADGATVTAA